MKLSKSEVLSVRLSEPFKLKNAVVWKSGIWLVSFAILFFALFYLNVFYLSKQQLTFSEFITILSFDTKKTLNDRTTDFLQVSPIQRSIWICLSSIVGAVSLVIGGAVIQSLTQNPLADTSTLGFLSSTIFGVILMKGVVNMIIITSNYNFFYFLFALLGGVITLVLLSFLFKQPHNKTQHLKVILIGLVLNMIFKTFTFLIKQYNSNTVTASFALAMGGAENIYGLYTNQFSFLKWCSAIVALLFVLSVSFSQKLNLFELGEDQAKTLGVNVKIFKIVGYTITLITSTIAIVLLGNITFLGLICAHCVRSCLKTSKYQLIIPLGSLLGIILLLLGVLINSFFPFIASSIFILSLGGIVLLFLTIKE